MTYTEAIEANLILLCRIQAKEQKTMADLMLMNDILSYIAREAKEDHGSTHETR